MTGPTHLLKQETGVAIDSATEVFETNLEYVKLVSLNIDATAEADYRLDVSPDGDTYFEAEREYLAADEDTTDVRDVFELTDRYVRLVVTSATAGGETADIVVQGVR